IFLGARGTPTPEIVIWLLRWLAFRIMFGAGMIKIRGDDCWRDLTCLVHHYETQPMPGPLSWFFHQLPVWAHKGGVLFNHFVELVVPFGLFGPRPVRLAAGVITIVFQMVLIFSGNLSWLNCITIVVCLACFDDEFFRSLGLGFDKWLSAVEMAAGLPAPVYWVLALAIGLLSIRPAMNLVSTSQVMNGSFDPLHLVNTYGAFGSVGRERDELLIEGTGDSVITDQTQWLEYAFKGKPGELTRLPPQVTPYHNKLDWQMWFAAMSPYYKNHWIVNMIGKFLQNEPSVMKLIRKNPFPEAPPKFIRARLFRYKFTTWGEKGWWRREERGIYLPPLSVDDPQFRKILTDQGWL
ncbi:MAG: lipase maturation factor family protein, partial [Bdellovibrionota bacterium]